MKLKTVIMSISVIMIFMISAITLNVYAEVIPGTNLSIHFESANIVGSGRHLNMHRVPLVDVDSGQTTYIDAAFEFTYMPNGGIEFVQISSIALSPPMLSVTNIIPGLYKSQNGRCYVLEGPQLLSENRSLYTLRSAGSEISNSCRDKNAFTTQIITGSAMGHPDIGHRNIVQFLEENYVYGYVAQSTAYDIFGDYWNTNELIGLRQSGNQLIVGLFSEGVDKNNEIIDFKTPRLTVILTRSDE